MDPKKFSSLEDKVSNEKNSLDECFQKVLSSMPNVPVNELNAAHLQGTKFFSKFESFLSSISSESESLSKTQIEDVLTSIENILDYSITYWDVMISTSTKTVSVPYSPDANFLKTSQQIFKTYKKNQALTLKNRFIKYNLPTNGFDAKGSYKLTSIKIDWVSLIIGIILFVASGLVVFFIDIDTGMEYLFSRILISLSVALIFSGVAKEKIQAKINISGLTITALGTIAIFFTLYFANPAEMPIIPG
ncbi:hypothetical protein [Celerinatantimonas yamalensis]|uniref:Uncharacterized protein n=1 Tax=Celerinatantimonas yamalensis TaxID=559956 RepID=A0ABW9G5M8_9GAMM